MNINGITFDPKQAINFSLASICVAPPIFRVKITFPDDMVITKDFCDYDSAQELIDKIKRAKAEEEVCDGVTFFIDSNRLSTNYITVETDKIDALFCKSGQIFAIIDNDKITFADGLESTLEKIAAYCKHLTNISRVYVNKAKSKGFFVDTFGKYGVYGVYISVGNNLLYVPGFSYGSYFNAIDHCKEFQTKYQFK